MELSRITWFFLCWSQLNSVIVLNWHSSLPGHPLSNHLLSAGLSVTLLLSQFHKLSLNMQLSFISCWHLKIAPSKWVERVVMLGREQATLKTNPLNSVKQAVTNWLVVIQPLEGLMPFKTICVYRHSVSVYKPTSLGILLRISTLMLFL